MLTGSSKLTLDIPRDRLDTFDPKLIAKYQRRFPDFNDKIISMYARSMTVTDAVLEAVTEWQGRPLDACYPLEQIAFRWTQLNA